MFDEYIHSRLERLKGHIQECEKLIGSYEVKLNRGGLEPGTELNYLDRVEELQRRIQGYHAESISLRKELAQIPSSPATANEILDWNKKLDEIDGKVERIDKRSVELLAGQEALSLKIDILQQLLAHYDARLQVVVKDITQHFEPEQLAVIKNLVAAVDANRFATAEMQQLTETLQQMLSDLKTQGQSIAHQEEIEEILTDPDISFNNKLKFSIPIIPLFLNYEGEVVFGNKMSLKALWQRFRGKIPVSE